MLRTDGGYIVDPELLERGAAPGMCVPRGNNACRRALGKRQKVRVFREGNPAARYRRATST